MSTADIDIGGIQAPPHLIAEAAALLSATDEVKIHYLRTDKWIGYPAAKEILDDLESLMSHPDRERMPCRLIVAQTNNGKTNLLKTFVKRHPADPNPEGEAVRIPIIHIQLVEPDERHLYLQLLKALFQKYPPMATLNARRDHVMNVLQQVRPRMILLDEINTLVNGPVVKQRACLNALKYISNLIRVPIVATGTHEARHVFRTEPQIANRFEPRALPLWELNDTFRSLLLSFERTLPLPMASGLHKKAMAHEIFHRTDGTIGEVAKLIETAAIHAVRNKADCISNEVLEKCGYVPPSRRHDLLGAR
jgi:hypothetical protein